MEVAREQTRAWMSFGFPPPETPRRSWNDCRRPHHTFSTAPDAEGALAAASHGVKSALIPDTNGPSRRRGAAKKVFIFGEFFIFSSLVNMNSVFTGSLTTNES